MGPVVEPDQCLFWTFWTTVFPTVSRPVRHFVWWSETCVSTLTLSGRTVLELRALQAYKKRDVAHRVIQKMDNTRSFRIGVPWCNG